MLRSATLATMIGASVCTNAAAQAPVVEQRTIEGEIRRGTLDSGLGDYTFITDSLEGETILEVCSMGQVCRADVILRNDLIIHVETVELAEEMSPATSTFDYEATKFESGAWRGLAFNAVDEATCMMGQPLNERVSFAVIATATGSFQIGVLGVSVEGESDAIPGAVTFDGAAPVILNGYVASSSMLMFEELRRGDAGSVVERQMRSSRGLRMSFEESQVDLELSGSNAAIDALMKCVSDADIQMEVLGDQEEYRRMVESEGARN